MGSIESEKILVIVLNQGQDRDGICRSWGQYHFETFDGIYYYFPGRCSYILAKDCHSTEPQYTIWVHNSRDCNSSVYSCPRSISLFFHNEEEIHIVSHEVKKGGRRLPESLFRLSLPITIRHVFIERLADYILVKSTFGFSLAWDGGTGVYIKMSEEHKEQPCGLCGNFNDNALDDLTTSYNVQTEDTVRFGNSWAVQIPTEPPCQPVEEDFQGPCATESEMVDAMEKCSAILFFPFVSCHENIDPNPYVSSCISDHCMSGDDDTFCRSIMEYTRACSHAGYPVREWRDNFPVCSDECEDSFVHRDCISCCPPTCTFEKECLGSNLHCLDGCYCPDGLIMENGTCIPVSNCPCVYHGTAYQQGYLLEQGCSACVCNSGTWNCTENNCSAECSVTGDTHVTSFDGRIFMLVGTCQYILVKSWRTSKFTVILQNMPCGEALEQSCIQSVILVVDEDVNKQVTLTRDGEVLIGINQAANLPYIEGDIEIHKITSLFIQIKTHFGVRIQFDGIGGRLYLQVESSWKGGTLGLCGTFNGNLRDDFLSPSGMIEGTPQLHTNAWKVSSACTSPLNIPLIDPCEMNQQNAFYASQCDVINEELFAPCHSYVSPSVYYQQCRYEACKCGSSCLCTALAHYAYICAKHKVIVNFRAHVSECGMICLGGMQYHSCTSTCGNTCHALSKNEECNDDCAEGCNCPLGTYFDEVRQRCVTEGMCHCYFLGVIYQAGEVSFSASGPCLCRNGRMECAPEEPDPEPGECPPGKIYLNCRDLQAGQPRTGIACEVTCRNLMMNLTCPPMTPCVSGCGCPPGLVRHKQECYFPENCPCAWMGQDYLPGEVVSTACYKCVCQRGFFNCTHYPCPAVCTVYSDRHYHTFDGLEYDYVSDCQVYLIKSNNGTEVSVTAENKDCYESGIICMKHLTIFVGSSKIYFNDNSGKPSSSSVIGRGYEFQLWKAGYYTVLHFLKQEITILWDTKTTVHIQAGPQWKGQLTGMCGNFDKITVNDMTTSSNIEVSNAQAFGDSWALGQCESDFVVKRPCEGDLIRQPYAKRECAILYSDVFTPCHNVVDVTWFYKNCLTDTCNCNRGGDCECLCTSIAAYAHKCCQLGVAVNWRSPSVCSYDCEYYNRELGEGPYILFNSAYNDTVFGANITSGEVFPLPKISAEGKVLFNFMIIAGLYKDRFSRLPVVSFESAERPNYFLCASEDGSLRLEQWSANEDFRKEATFLHHQGLWMPGYSSFELYNQKGFFVTLTRFLVRAVMYDNTEEFKHISSFTIEDSSTIIPYRMMCEWRYHTCSSPCVKTCSDPEASKCIFLPPVEGCFPRCPKNMILDEVTRRCVYPEDCIVLPPTPTPYMVVTRLNRTTSVPSATSRTTTMLTTSAVTEMRITPVKVTVSEQTNATATPEYTTARTTPTTTELSSSSIMTTSAVTSSFVTSTGILTTLSSADTLITLATEPKTAKTTQIATSAHTPPSTVSTEQSISVPYVSTSRSTVYLVEAIQTTTAMKNRTTEFAPVVQSTTIAVTTPHSSTATTFPLSTEEKLSSSTTLRTEIGSSTSQHPQTMDLETRKPSASSTSTTETEFTTASELTTLLLSSTTSLPSPSVAPIMRTTLQSTTDFTTYESTLPVTSKHPFTTIHNFTTTIESETTETVKSETITQEHTTAMASPVGTDHTTAAPPSTTTSPATDTISTFIPSLLQPTSTCTPPFSYRVDECSEYICFNGHLMFHNASLHCRNNVTQPNCGLLGMPVQINKDPCCPQWECPCRCSIISDLRVITFDGNNVALYDNGSYILVNLPRENIVAHIEKCPTSESVNSIRRPTATGGTSGLCFKKLNITTHSFKILINRLDRKVSINFINGRLPFTRQSLHIDDTGTMYVINTPGGVSIQWYHSTGIIVLQYNSPYNTTSGTQGLCGCCDGNPADDLKLPNGTIIKNVEDIPIFLYSWMVNTSEETDYFRRVGYNCTTGNCTKCFQMLNQNPFTACHEKVSPEQFCDKIWAGDLHYKDHECDFLAAYVAICYTHNICINWRKPEFCPLKCPPGKEYHPCVSTCKTKTCQNREYYEESTCSYIREECVCKSGTILHRADSAFCVTEDQCVCTDNEGRPRAPGEVWNGSNKGCCMYRCMENGSVIAVEPDCSEVPSPICEREGEYVIDVIEEGACCPKKICECNLTICDNEVPTCENGNKLMIGYSTISCCPEYRCECDSLACPTSVPLECREDQFLVEVREDKSCCYSYLCVCESCIDPIPVCNEGEILAVDLNTTQQCCPQYHCVCDETLCHIHQNECLPGMNLIRKTVPGKCCPEWHCECNCQNNLTQLCQLGELPVEDHTFSSACGCTQYICKKADVCLFQGITMLSPGQSMIQYFEGDLCHTVQCLQEIDLTTGFHSMDVVTVNCSEKCGEHQIYIPSSDPHTCCGSCKNVSCTFGNENETLDIYTVGSTWVSNCTRFDCVETAVGAVILGSGVVCPPFNETDCIQNGGTVQSYNDGCCKTCKDDGRTCKKVTVRTTIRKDDCRSTTPVIVTSCDGKCPSATIFNFNVNSHARFCKCCRESGLQNRTVPLFCTRNSTSVDYVFLEPTDCSCQWN
ncbi:otogelin-like protein [Erpetoichthys calabaricus]|uniref:otogelin-like protein n=1 Tax=Erpetoichthys calabaricus TaxID=27687 RepID=UPI00223476DB|nr:otogelin-like protein [Erpetoichthys calabaricus]